jgi:hypothetical protein
VQEEVKTTLMKLGQVISGDPLQILLDQIFAAHGMVLALREQVAELRPDQHIDIEEHPVEAAKARYLLKQYSTWSDKAAMLSALALRAGVEERTVRVAETQALSLIGAIRQAVLDAGLTEEQQNKVLQSVAHQMRMLAA